MAATVQYLDEHGIIITEKQCSVIGRYSKITYIDNALKIIEEFGRGSRNRDVRGVQYFMDASERKSDVLKGYTDGKTRCTLRFNDKSQNGFTQWDVEEYNIAGVLKWKGNGVYDNANRLVMYCYFDLNTGALQDGVKNLYGNIHPKEFDDLLLRFRYDNTGQIEDISDVHVSFGFNDGSLTLDEFLAFEANFPWDQHPYFHSITPYLPDSLEI